MYRQLQVAGGGKGKMVSYPYFMAFIALLNNMELLKQILDIATKRSSVVELTKGSVVCTFVFLTWCLNVSHLLIF